MMQPFLPNRPNKKEPKSFFIMSWLNTYENRNKIGTSWYLFVIRILFEYAIQAINVPMPRTRTLGNPLLLYTPATVKAKAVNGININTNKDFSNFMFSIIPQVYYIQ